MNGQGIQHDVNKLIGIEKNNGKASGEDEDLYRKRIRAIFHTRHRRRFKFSDTVFDYCKEMPKFSSFTVPTTATQKNPLVPKHGVKKAKMNTKIAAVSKEVISLLGTEAGDDSLSAPGTGALGQGANGFRGPLGLDLSLVTNMMQQSTNLRETQFAYSVMSPTKKKAQAAMMHAKEVQKELVSQSERELQLKEIDAKKARLAKEIAADELEIEELKAKTAVASRKRREASRYSGSDGSGEEEVVVG